MYRIMLVEDEVNIREGLKKLIESVIGGFRVVAEGGSGKEALELIPKTRPDLVITDIRMKELNGLEMIERIRNSNPVLPILILSGYGEFEYAKEALRNRVAGYLLKPIDRVELTQYLMKIKADLDRARGGEGPDASSPESKTPEGREIQQTIRKVQELIEQRLDQEISLQYMGDQVHLNHQYLSALFKTETGENFYDYVTRKRMNKAKHLLRQTNLKIYEIANLSGYGSAKHFMAVFKQAVGVTPTEFRNGV